MRPPLADDAFEFHAAGVVEHRLTVVGGQAFGEADTALNFAQEARHCRTALARMFTSPSWMA